MRRRPARWWCSRRWHSRWRRSRRRRGHLTHSGGLVDPLDGQSELRCREECTRSGGILHLRCDLGSSYGRIVESGQRDGETKSHTRRVTERTTAPTLTLAVCAICSRNPSCTVGVKSETLPATTMEVVIIAAVGGVAVGGEAAASKGGGDGTSKSESNVLVLVM